MHDCPICGTACDCDMEDTWLEAPSNCRHNRMCEKLEDKDNDPIADYFDDEKSA